LEDKQRIYAWIDANVPYYGTYAHSRPDAPGRRDLCFDAEGGQPSEWYARDFLGVYDRRCAECHGKLEGTIDWEGRFAWINFSKPALSPALTAHLAKDQGGRGISTVADRDGTFLFTSTDDPDYRMMLEAIETGKRLSLQTPRADMPGFAGRRSEP
jgi:mono/diheme cytochrome c family protein